MVRADDGAARAMTVNRLLTGCARTPMWFRWRGCTTVGMPTLFDVLNEIIADEHVPYLAASATKARACSSGRYGS